jgi:ABC-type glutathione transport system ATPase component
MGLLPPKLRVTAGSIRLQDQELVGLIERDYEKVRGTRISLIFQETAMALNPVLRIRDQVAEVARAHDGGALSRCRELADTILAEVGLDKTAGHSYPHQLSGGQRQRGVIAQALCCRPRLVIADEPTASLDTTTQAEILDLLKHLQAKTGMAVLFISHNPAVLLRVATRVLVMDQGRIVEQGAVRDVFLHPRHARTRALLDSLPRAARAGARILATHAD